MFQILKVTGNSLHPDFVDGDYVLVSKRPFFRKLNAGNRVVFHHPEYGVLIKIIESVSGDGKEIFVVGRDLHSVDSRTFGPICLQEILGKVIWHIRRTPK